MREAKEYISRANKYWQQALTCLRRGEVEKASELAWGSATERIKALALLRWGRLLRSHKQIHTFVSGLSRSLGDEELYRLFREAESLHTNFYESHLDMGDVRMTFSNIEKLLIKLDNLFYK